jgi:hypothetical protein
MTNIQVKSDSMPEELATRGRGILKVLAQADKAAYDYEVKTQTAAAMVVEAKAMCEEYKFAFTKFTKTIGLGKSRAYELLAIAEGRKTLDEVRAATAARQRKLQEARKASQEAQEGDSEDSEGEGTRKASKARPGAPEGDLWDISWLIEDAGDKMLEFKGDPEGFKNWLHDELAHTLTKFKIPFTD